MKKGSVSAELVELVSRQLLLDEVGSKGFRRLLDSKVVVVGCGATGSLIAELLTRAGVGHIRLIDRDFVDLSNLNRSHLFSFEDAKRRRPKSKACLSKLRLINPFIKLEAVVTDFDPIKAIELTKGFDLILDATDNFQTRYLINEVSISLGIPWVHVGVERWHGQVALFVPGKTACLRCVIPEFNDEAEDACEIRGVINTAVGVLASIAANEAIKYILGLTKGGTLYVYDALSNTLDRITLHRNPACTTCSRKEFKLLGSPRSRVRVICGSNSVEIIPDKPARLNVRLLKDCLASQGLQLKSVSEDTLTVSLGEYTATFFSYDGRCIIEGTLDAGKALQYYQLVASKIKKCGANSV